MNEPSIPSGWGVWFHGTAHRFDSFDNEAWLSRLGGDSNSGLGHFVAATISGAVRYVAGNLERGERADVLVVAACGANSYAASFSEFWCEDEFSGPEGLALADSMGHLPPGGCLTRELLSAQGYASIAIDDLDGSGPVMAVFDAMHLRVLSRMPAPRAIRLELWLDKNSPPHASADERWALIRKWCANDAALGRSWAPQVG